jgi:microcystin-dependent protein
MAFIASTFSRRTRLRSSGLTPWFCTVSSCPIPNTQYPELFNTIGTGFGGTADPDFNLPDLRGMFLRGAALDAQQDPDIASRAAQAVNGNTG